MREGKSERLIIERTEREMRALLDMIDYDWSTYTLEGFKEYVERCTQRRITFVLLPMRSASGGWVATADRDYVFIAADLPVFMQNHSALHELAHIICNHPSIRLSDILSGEEVSKAGLLLRDVCSDEVDLQAESLAALFQERIMYHDRMQELTRGISSVERMTAFLTAMDLA